MKNLLGYEDATAEIRRELAEAGIGLSREARTTGEVPSALTGKLKGWKFERNWTYWTGRAILCEGLPVDAAKDLFHRPYHEKGPNQPEIFGEVVRAAGDADGRAPEIKASKGSDGNLYVKAYDVDTQEGLNVLAQAIIERGV